MNAADRTLQEYYALMDEDLRALFNTDPLFYKAVHHGAANTMGYLLMLECALKAMAKERDSYKELSLSQALRNGCPVAG